MTEFTDSEGNVLAMKDTIVKHPWIVLPSSKYKGRFYYFNTETKTNAWALHPSLIGRAPAAVQDAPETAKPSDLDLPCIVELASFDGKVGDATTVPKHDQRPSNLEQLPSKHEQLPSMVRRQSYELRVRREHLFSVTSEPKQGSFDIPESTLPESETVALPLRVVRGLGQGGYGVVMEVKHKIMRRRFAMKVVSKDKLRSRRERERMALELKIMECMSPSPFTQQLHMSFETKTSIFMVMDLHGGGDLFFHLMERIETCGTAFSEKEVCVLLAEVTLALEHVHKEGYIHRDLKVENVMLDSSGHVKLIDFGLAFEMSDEVQPLSPTGSLIYMPPEMIFENMGGRHTDWWAMGVLGFELLTGRSPWPSVEDKTLLKQEIKSLQVTVPVGISAETNQFITMLLQRDYRMRLGSRSDSEVKAAPFFHSIDWKKTAALETAPALTLQSDNVGVVESSQAERIYRELSQADSLAPHRRTSFSMGLRVIDRFPE